ncbi:thioredoxin family protein [Blastopirellula marina]|nr:thioredoxin family protein [Blastopirellula marina]
MNHSSELRTVENEKSTLSRFLRQGRAWMLAIPLALPLVASPVMAAEEPAAGEATDTEEAAPQPKHVDWMTDLAAAQKLAKKENKNLILFFTGSDWCGYCVKLEKAVLTQPGTAERFDENFIPVVLDFPNRKQLPAETKLQNNEMKQKLSVSGFPTLVFADADLMPQGQIRGYRPADAFWKQYDEIVAAGETIAAAKDGAAVADITDYKQLNAILEAVPEDLLEKGWLETMRRAADASKGLDDAVSQKWGDKVAEIEVAIAERKFGNDLVQGMVKTQREAKSPAEVIAYFDEAADGAADYPKRIVMIKFLKMRYCAEQKMYDEGIVIADVILASDAAGEREKLITSQIKNQMVQRKEAKEKAAAEEEAEQ